MSLSRTTPILRIFDEAKAREFYLDFLGFEVVFEHRFEPRGDCTLHLSEHHGDACPGAAMRIEADDIDALCAQLRAKRFRYARPDVETMPWGTRDMTIVDPFGNRLTFTSVISV
ncbi:MAG: VOC family protein [Burkholderiaceae bacterium]|nr:VOC family protein [Burkholderiaceae bacterium]